MSDSDTIQKLMSRLASLESEVSGYRKAPAATGASEVATLVAAMRTDPAGTMAKMGVPVEHVTKLLVAHAMGDQAPQELKMLAALGPQMNATHALEAKLEALSRQFSDVTKGTVRESFKAFATDKSKYPHLAKAYAADPAFFDEDLESHGGSAEELAKKVEARQKKAAEIYSPAASTEHADTTQVVQSQQDDKPATNAGALSGTPPPIPQGPKLGLITPEENNALKAEILRKFTPGT